MEKFKLFQTGRNVLYYISNNGKVKTIKISDSKEFFPKPINRITCEYDKQGYLVIGVRINGQTKSKYLHRLVIENFGTKTGDKSGYEVNHIDGDKHNNNIENLEWVTRSANVKEAYRLNLIKKSDNKGVKNPNYGKTKYSTDLIDFAIQLIKNGNSIASAARMSGINGKNLWRYKKRSGL